MAEVRGPDAVRDELEGERERLRKHVAELAAGNEGGPSFDENFADYGQVAAEQGCLRCHTTDGSPHIGPTWAGLYGAAIPLADGGEIAVDEAYITESMMDPAAKIHRGFQAVMPSYLGRIRPPGLLIGSSVAASTSAT